MYHALTREKIKKVFRLIDHSVIFIMISGTTLAINLIAVFPYNKPISLVTGITGLVITVVGISLTFVDQEKFKNLQLILYVVLGFTCVFLGKPIIENNESALTILILLLSGGIVYGIGMGLYIVGKKKKYFHSIFHLFVLAGTVIHFFAIIIALT